MASSRQIVSPQPLTPPAVSISTMSRVTPVRTPEPQTIGFFTGTRTSQRRMDAIARSDTQAPPRKTARSRRSSPGDATANFNIYDF